jgi:hypothetical protein
MDEKRAPIDTAVLDLFRKRARTHPLVSRIEAKADFDAVSTLVLRFEKNGYPESVSSARLEIQWHENGEYNFHYHERHESGQVWQCRWDRHPNSHSTNAHFHRPPSADTSDVIADPTASTRPEEMFTRTLANARQRIDELWE